jgi:hypothetical protein
MDWLTLIVDGLWIASLAIMSSVSRRTFGSILPAAKVPNKIAKRIIHIPTVAQKQSSKHQVCLARFHLGWALENFKTDCAITHAASTVNDLASMA